MRFASSEGLVKYLREHTNGIITIYGPSASGKTLFCLISAIETAKLRKVIYIDSTNGFSVSRIKQLCGTHRKILEEIFLLKPKNFYEQKNMIEGLKNNISKDIGLIIIDTISYFYRLELAKKDPSLINRVLISQLNCLNEIAEKNNIPVILTNHVYDDLDKKDEVKMIGGEIIKKRSRSVIELKNYKTIKKAIIKKPVLANKEFLYRIEEKGIVEITPR